MRVAAVVVLAALLSVVYAQNKCTGMNVTMNPGLQPFTTAASTPSTTLYQDCPYGFFSDTTQGGRCITYRQGVNNFFDAPCYVQSDCGASALGLACGERKKCTWRRTRQLDDSCTDSINCRTYPATNGSTIEHGCSASTKKCAPMVHVLGGVNFRCNYTSGNERYMCDDATTCMPYVRSEVSLIPNLPSGAGICVPLRAAGEVCVNTADPTQYKYPNLWCANKLACFGEFSNNRTCVPPKNAGDTCWQFGRPYECAAGLYCNGDTKQCAAYVGAGVNCTGNFLENPTTGNICQMGLRCITNPANGFRQCATAAPAGQICSTGGVNSGNNCTTGLQCISQPQRGMTIQCSAGANGDICQIYGSTLIDSCQPGLFCQNELPANYTCIPKFDTGVFCNVTNQCKDGTYCYNNTCTAYQDVGQACHELLLGTATTGTNALNYLKCNPSIQCSRGVCINNYTVPIDGFCSQDQDCEHGHCDAVLRRCTRRKLCTGDSAGCTCVCSSGADNMGQCIMSTVSSCGKANNALRNCLNPLDYTPYANTTFFRDPYTSAISTTFAYLDSGSSYYTKCASQHADYVRCRGLMAKWGYPAVPLGDFINYDLATISASSSVSVSFVVMIAFVMSVIMNL